MYISKNIAISVLLSSSIGLTVTAYDIIPGLTRDTQPACTALTVRYNNPADLAAATASILNAGSAFCDTGPATSSTAAPPPATSSAIPTPPICSFQLVANAPTKIYNLDTIKLVDIGGAFEMDLGPVYPGGTNFTLDASGHLFFGKFQMYVDAYIDQANPYFASPLPSGVILPVCTVHADKSFTCMAPGNLSSFSLCSGSVVNLEIPGTAEACTGPFCHCSTLALTATDCI